MRTTPVLLNRQTNVLQFKKPQNLQLQPKAIGQERSTPIDSQKLRSALMAQIKFGNSNVKWETPRSRDYVSIAPEYEHMLNSGGNTPAGRMPVIIHENPTTGAMLPLDLISANYANNIVYFTTDFNPNTAEIFNLQMDFLKNKILKAREARKDSVSESESDAAAEEVVSVIIDSPGGYISSLYSMLDTIEGLKRHDIKVATYCRSMAASCGSLLFSYAGTPGMRYVTPLGRVLVHQPLGGSRGQATDINNQNNEIQEMKVVLTNMLAKSAIDGKIYRLQKELENPDNGLSHVEKAQRETEIKRLEAEKQRIEKLEAARRQRTVMYAQAESLEATDQKARAKKLREEAEQLPKATEAKMKEEAKHEEQERLTRLIQSAEGDERKTLQEELESLKNRDFPYSVNRQRLADVMERDRWLNAEEALEYGLADHIATH